MKNLMLCLCLFVCVGNAVFAQKRLALIIGNAAYESNPLRNPVNDANDMANAAKQAGFELVLPPVLNVNQDSMNRVLYRFQKEIQKQPNTISLFYFAGHGVQINGKNYLLGIKNQTLRDEMDVERHGGLELEEVLQRTKPQQGGCNLIIVDACRDNPLPPSRFRSSQRGIERVSSNAGSIIMYSTAANTTASDGTGSNGLFTGILKQKWTQKGLSIVEIFTETALEVKERSEQKQCPELSIQYYEKLVLLPKDTHKVVNLPRFAFIIGNQDYKKYSKLINPINDAKDMARVAQNTEFELIRSPMLDANSTTMKNGLQQFAKTIAKTPNSLRLFYYSGFSNFINDKNYLISVDSDMEATFGISLEDVLHAMQALPSQAMDKGHNLIILDACVRNGSEMVQLNANTSLITAAAWNAVAHDGTDRDNSNSPFTESLLKNWVQQDWTISKIVQETKKDVIQITDHRQVPQFLGTSDDIVISIDIAASDLYQADNFYDKGFYDKAFSLYVKHQTKPFFDAKYKVRLGYAYEKQGNDTQAIEWYKKAADTHSPSAWYHLGQIYSKPNGNLQESFTCYQKAADLNYKAAKMWVGLCYKDGKGVTKNEANAIQWLKKAADEQYPEAAYQLGLLYESGNCGLTKNLSTAQSYYDQAVKNNHTGAQIALKRLQQKK